MQLPVAHGVPSPATSHWALPEPSLEYLQVQQLLVTTVPVAIPRRSLQLLLRHLQLQARDLYARAHRSR